MIIVLLCTFSVTVVDSLEKLPSRDTSRTYEPLLALTRRFPNKSCPWLTDDSQWKSCVHPEGALYLYDGSRRAYTEANIDEITFREVDGCVDALYELARNNSVDLTTGDIELVVQLEVAQDEVSCQYYFVDHKERTVFWLHDPSEATESIFSALQGVYDPSHMGALCGTYDVACFNQPVGYALEDEYWTHCEHYPNHRMDRKKLVKELRELVMHASAEIITSDTSLSPFDSNELSKIMELLGHLQENAADNDFLHSTCVIARFMHYFCRAKFFNFCGLPCARLDADKSVYPEDTGFHLLASSISFAIEAILFWAPRARLENLRRVWVDESIIMPRWKDFNTNLMAEWTGITIYVRIVKPASHFVP
ncbi:hypothetical protein K503DRAFT_285380 [Rhizopogon vinicolor AM-OR11-026]|uniref:WW domain-containing protein n=1 Tax=Rhizopogon vinicolor AM-OR11-026 TaxID=1314800 RepID=A0A1B7MVN7_9AGAM|nr:hypothetical protein K503DRAFT_285380 [Rhizopogon vinicolor AM-OR11-026]